MLKPAGATLADELMSPQWAVVVGASLLALTPLVRGAGADAAVTAPGPGVVFGRVLDPNYRKKCPRPLEANTVFAQRVTRIRVTTDAHGALTNAQVRWSSGSAQLDAAALECIRKQRFSPTTRNGVPVASVQFIAWWWKVSPKPLRTCTELRDPADASLPPPPGVVDELRVGMRGPGVSRLDLSGKGATVVCLCTDEAGNPVGDPVLSVSSGSRQLDAGAIKFARGVHYADGGTGCLRLELSFYVEP
jgi:TonB family protein